MPRNQQLTARPPLHAGNHLGGFNVWLDESAVTAPLSFLARITEWEVIPTTDARWIYAWVEVQFGAAAPYPLSDLSGGRTGSLTEDFALNLTELNNGLQGVGVQGNSVDQSASAYPGGFTLQPVGAGTAGTPGNSVVVRLWPYITATGVVRYVFEYQNADDGTC